MTGTHIPAIIFIYRYLHFFEQLPPHGQPTHLFAFLALYTYLTANPSITKRLTIIKKFSIMYSYHTETDFFTFTFRSALIHKYAITKTIPKTAISPGKNPAPKLPVVTSVPI